MTTFIFSDDNKARYADHRVIATGIVVDWEPSKNYLEGLTCSDVFVLENRRIVSFFDASDVLRHFAREQAMINIQKIKPYCSAEDFNLIISWLESGDPKLRVSANHAAEFAAASAAEFAAESTAIEAANDHLIRLLENEYSSRKSKEQ